MGALLIDSMVLQVPGLSESQGRRLALGVSQRLGAGGQPAQAREIPSLRVEVTAGAGTPESELADRIAAGILREIRRLP